MTDVNMWEDSNFYVKLKMYYLGVGILDTKSFLTMDLFLFYCNSIGWIFGFHHAKNGLMYRKMVVDCLILITSIGDTLFQTKPDQKRGIFRIFRNRSHSCYYKPWFLFICSLAGSHLTIHAGWLPRRESFY